MDTHTPLPENDNNTVVPSTSGRVHPYKRPDRSGKTPMKRNFRFNKKDANATSYQAQTVPRSLVVQPIKRYFQLHTGSKHLVSMARTVYNVIVTRDRKLAVVSPEAFIHATLIGFHYRLIQTGISCGYSFPTYSISSLADVARALLLPDIICKAIESIGAVTLPNGMTVVPRIPTDTEMGSSTEFVHPKTLELTAAATAPDDQLFYKGALRQDICVDFISKTTIGVKANVLFRKIAYDNIEGRPEFAIAREDTEARTIARAMYPIEDALAHLGAVYGFRSLPKDPKLWLGSDEEYFSYTHASTEFQPDLFIVHKIATELPSTR